MRGDWPQRWYSKIQANDQIPVVICCFIASMPHIADWKKPQHCCFGLQEKAILIEKNHSGHAFSPPRHAFFLSFCLDNPSPRHAFPTASRLTHYNGMRCLLGGLSAVEIFTTRGMRCLLGHGNIYYKGMRCLLGARSEMGIFTTRGSVAFWQWKFVL